MDVINQKISTLTYKLLLEKKVELPSNQATQAKNQFTGNKQIEEPVKSYPKEAISQIQEMGHSLGQMSEIKEKSQDDYYRLKITDQT